MKLPISQILSESWDDLAKLIVKPVIWGLILIPLIVLVLIGFLISFVMPEKTFTEFTPTVITTLIIMAVIFLLILLAAGFIYIYLIKLIYNIKKGETQNVFSEVLSVYPRFLWYILMVSGIMMLVMSAVFIPATILSVIIGEEVYWLWFISIVICIPLVIYLSIRLSFIYLIVILEKDDTPIATGWERTKGYFWGIFLMYIILYICIGIAETMVTGLLEAIITLVLKSVSISKDIAETIAAVITLPIFILVGIYTIIANLNTFLACRPRPKLQPIVIQEEPPIN